MYKKIHKKIHKKNLKKNLQKNLQKNTRKAFAVGSLTDEFTFADVELRLTEGVHVLLPLS
jgi:DNA repair photolyase